MRLADEHPELRRKYEQIVASQITFGFFEQTWVQDILHPNWRYLLNAQQDPIFRIPVVIIVIEIIKSVSGIKQKCVWGPKDGVSEQYIVENCQTCSYETCNWDAFKSTNPIHFLYTHFLNTVKLTKINSPIANPFAINAGRPQ